jgi:hypothetical protein
MEREELLSIQAVREFLPEIDGRKPCAATIRKWATKGCYGVRLDHVRIGGRILTSVAAIQRFEEQVREATAVLT